MSLCNLGDHICEQYSNSGLTNITKALVKTTGHLHRNNVKSVSLNLSELSITTPKSETEDTDGNIKLSMR